MFVQKPLLFKNLQANNGFSVSATWNNGKTQNIEIESRNGNICTLRTPQNWKNISVRNGNRKVELKADKAGKTISFETQTKQTYTIMDEK